MSDLWNYCNSCSHTYSSVGISGVYGHWRHPCNTQATPSLKTIANNCFYNCRKVSVFPATSVVNSGFYCTSTPLLSCLKQRQNDATNTLISLTWHHFNDRCYLWIRVVGIGARLGQQTNRGSIPKGCGMFSLLQSPCQVWGPPTLILNGHRGVLSLGIKRTECGVKHSCHLLPCEREWLN